MKAYVRLKKHSFAKKNLIYQFLHFKVLMDLLCVATYSQPTTTAKNNGKEGFTFVSIGIRL